MDFFDIRTQRISEEEKVIPTQHSSEQGRSFDWFLPGTRQMWAGARTDGLKEPALQWPERANISVIGRKELPRGEN